MPRAPRTPAGNVKLVNVIQYNGFLIGLDQQGVTYVGRFEPHSALNEQIGMDIERTFTLEWYLIPQSFFTYNVSPQ